MSAWVDGTKVTFDLTGQLNNRGEITVGCQVFTVPEVVKAGGKLKIEDKRVEITGLVGTLNGSLRVAFEGTDRVFDRHQVVGYGRNLKVEEPARPKLQPEDLVPGMVLTDQHAHYWVVLGSRRQEKTGARRGWPVARLDDASTHVTWDYLSYWQEEGYELRVSESFPLDPSLKPAPPDPATLSWQEGDRIRWNDGGGVRTRRADGRWNDGAGSPVVGWTDGLYEEDIARGHITVLRKGGVDLPTAA